MLIGAKECTASQVSMDYLSPAIDKLIRGITFCAVIPIFYTGTTAQNMMRCINLSVLSILRCRIQRRHNCFLLVSQEQTRKIVLVSRFS
eukprot:COSAG01_NODE_1840_length_9078_cov_149.015481_10_plen_89_part_00